MTKTQTASKTRKARPAIEGLEDCGLCGNTGWVVCNHKGTGRDEDGWCTECDAPADEPNETYCPTCEPL